MNSPINFYLQKQRTQGVLPSRAFGSIDRLSQTSEDDEESRGKEIDIIKNQIAMDQECRTKQSITAVTGNKGSIAVINPLVNQDKDG